MKGTVAWFREDHGYGFIQPDGTTEKENQIFVHYSSIKSKKKFKVLVMGQRVEFTKEVSPKGASAAHVVVIDQ